MRIPCFSKILFRGPLVVVLLLPWYAPASAQSVEFFSPQGEVKAVRQVTARFAQAMVPFGEPREVDPCHRLRRAGQGPLGGHEELGL